MTKVATTVANGADWLADDDRDGIERMAMLLAVRVPGATWAELATNDGVPFVHIGSPALGDARSGLEGQLWRDAEGTWRVELNGIEVAASRVSAGTAALMAGLEVAFQWLGGQPDVVAETAPLAMAD